MKNARQRSLSRGKGKFLLDWDEYIYYINRLIKKIKQSKSKFDCVYGIPRGGLFPATIISHQLGIEFVEILNCRLCNNMLIVDDICDTGETINSLNFDKTKCKLATIFKHKDSPIEPDFYAKMNTKWVVFPYEKG